VVMQNRGGRDDRQRRGGGDRDRSAEDRDRSAEDRDRSAEGRDGAERSPVPETVEA
jgi:hypothetical protein